MTKIRQKQPIEVSTGLFTTNYAANPGSNYKGRPYSHIARNYVPDHLAILLDQVGACSIQDGCGITFNKKGRTMTNKCKCNGTCEKCKKKKLSREEIINALALNTDLTANELEQLSDGSLEAIHESHLISNAAVTGFKDKDSGKVYQFNTSRMIFVRNSDMEEEEEGEEEEEEEETPEEKVKNKGKGKVKNCDKGMEEEEPTENSWKEYVDKAPPQLKKILEETIKNEKKNRQTLIQKIVTNARLLDSEGKKDLAQKLSKKSKEELETLALVANISVTSSKEPVSNSNSEEPTQFIGFGGNPPPTRIDVTVNSADDPPYPCPELVFTK
jgi:hypothetical protein